MNTAMLKEYVCPKSRKPLALEQSQVCDDKIEGGILVSDDKLKYEIRSGVPHFIHAGQLSQIELETKQQYEEYYTEEFYDNIMDWLFQSFYEDEETVRETMIEALRLQPNSRVLEIGCGTGCDSYRIAKRLGPDGELFMQDLSASMVDITRKRLERDYKTLDLSCDLNYFVSSARNLPFPNEYFDALYHFGGFNNFEDPKGTLEEFSRVVKPGGKVVFGDESVPPWLENTTFGNIVCTNNPLFKYKVPLEHLPEGARNVNVRWLLGSCFYLIDYAVGSGPPPLNLDLPHKGRRGGTMRTRYFGQLEGVSPEVKKMALDAARMQGVSMHEWLEDLVASAAKKDLAKAKS